MTDRDYSEDYSFPIYKTNKRIPPYRDEGSRVWDAQREISKLSDRLIQLDMRVDELEKARFKRHTGVRKAER